MVRFPLGGHGGVAELDDLGAALGIDGEGGWGDGAVEGEERAVESVEFFELRGEGGVRGGYGFGGGVEGEGELDVDVGVVHGCDCGGDGGIGAGRREGGFYGLRILFSWR